MIESGGFRHFLRCCFGGNWLFRTTLGSARPFKILELSSVFNSTRLDLFSFRGIFEENKAELFKMRHATLQIEHGFYSRTYTVPADRIISSNHPNWNTTLFCNSFRKPFSQVYTSKNFIGLGTLDYFWFVSDYKRSNNFIQNKSHSKKRPEIRKVW